MAYFVTGGTGFIGSRLVERLLEKRQGTIYVLVRDSSTARLNDLIERWSMVVGSAAAERVQPVVGDLRRPLLGVEKEQVAELRGKVTHFFHLAAVYDMPATAPRAARVGAARRPRPRLDERRARRLGCGGARADRARAGPRRSRVPPHRPAPAARRRADQRAGRGRARAALRAQHRQTPDRPAAEVAA